MTSLPPLACSVLFDIDGTIVTGSPHKPSAGVLAMNRAALEVTGVDGLSEKVEFAGRTDRQIARDLVAASGRGSPGAEARLLELYLRFLDAGVVTRPCLLLGGVREAVAELRLHGATVGLGTGNVRRGAETKLRSAGIGDLFDHDLGGYGDDGDDRAEVLRVGALRCDPEGRLRVVIVGDTPHDVRAAHAIGAICVAVTTGLYDEEALAGAGADRVVARLGAELASIVRGLY